MARRWSWTIPQPGNPKFRKDVMEGTQGQIEGWADLEQRQVLVKVVLNLASGPKTVVQEAYPRNLKLTSEYNEAKVTGEALPEEPSSSSGPNDNKAGAPEWALEGCEPDRVKVEPSLKNLSADSEKALKSFLLRSRVGGALRP